MFGLMSAILIISIGLLCTYVLRDIKSRPLKSVAMASKYRELSDQLLTMIRKDEADLPKIMPVLLEWANLDAAIRGQDCELRNQILALFLIHNYPFEPNRAEISHFIKSAGASGAGRDPVAGQKEGLAPEEDAGRLTLAPRPEAAVLH